MKKLGFCAALLAPLAALLSARAPAASGAESRASPRPASPRREARRGPSSPGSRERSRGTGPSRRLQGLLLRVPRHRRSRRRGLSIEKLIDSRRGLHRGPLGATGKTSRTCSRPARCRPRRRRLPHRRRARRGRRLDPHRRSAYEATHAGDPGRVTVRRLTSAEYAYAIRDLTGVDIKIGIDASSDSVGGEGFANFGDVQFVQDADRRALPRSGQAGRRSRRHRLRSARLLHRLRRDRPRAVGARSHQRRSTPRKGFRVVSGEGGRPVRPRALRQGVLRRLALQAPRGARRSGGDDARPRGEGRHHRPLRRAHLDGRQPSRRRLPERAT